MKNYLNKLLLFVLLLGGLHQTLSGQVQGLSYTLSPYAEYNWQNDNSGLADGMLIGGQLGMAFGEFVELRANYSQGLNLETALDRYGFEPTDLQLENYDPREVTLRRYSGELKLNLSTGAFLPYATVGTGIQSISYDGGDENEQIFFNAGLGLKFSAGDRYTIGVQALNYYYRLNPVTTLMTDEDRTQYGLDVEDFETEQISNWGLRGSLVFYLGGREPGKLTDVDRAYLDQFSGGFSGLNVPIEIQFNKMNFHENLPYRDTWLAGASAGLNFGPLVGVRGFYWRGLEDNELTKFDDLHIYGGEARFKLNEGQGFTPWITLGGGNIEVGDEYIGRDSTLLGASNKGFAMGGLGMDLPFSKYFKLTGYVRSFVTTSQDIEDLTLPEQVNASWNYGVSLNFVIGKEKKKIDVVKQSAFDEYIMNTKQANQAARENLKLEYENRIADLEMQLEEAVKLKDVEAVKAISEEKEKAENVVSELEKEAIQEEVSEEVAKLREENEKLKSEKEKSSKSVEREVEIIERNSQPNNSGGQINMSAYEFQMLIKEILDGAQQQQARPQPRREGPRGNVGSDRSSNEFEDQLESLQKSLEELKSSIKSLKNAEKDSSLNRSSGMMDELKSLNKTLDERATALENKIAKNEENFEAIRERLIEYENSGQEGAQLQTFESKQFQKDIDYTNERIDDLRELMLVSLQKIENQQANSSQSPVIIEREVIKENGNSDSNNSIQETNTEVLRVQESNRTKVQTSPTYAPSGIGSKLRYNGMSAFAGFGVGETTSFNLGYRLHYLLNEKGTLEFMPESFFGFGSPSTFGIMANGVYHMKGLIKSNPSIVPYAGAGVGLMKTGDEIDEDQLKGAFNLMLGTSLNVLSGDLYVDFTTRNFFDINQIIVGYRLPF